MDREFDIKTLKENLQGGLSGYRPRPFWSWNDDLKKEELLRQIDQMKEKGIGGFFMHARGGLKTEYLSKEWFDCIRACTERAKELGMEAWGYDENGWPSGFAGMKLLEDSANHEQYLVRKVGDFDPSANASYLVKDGKCARVSESKGEGEYINVYVKTNPSVVDVMNPAIVRKFIDLTHERYKKELGDDFGKYMLGFFTDEPQYYRWETPYSPCLAERMKKEYGVDLWDELGKLFCDAEGSKRFRYLYWNCAHKQFIESFIKQIYDWCNENGCRITGHDIEESRLFTQMWCCGGLMDFYEYEHIPGMDWLGRNVGDELAPKQLGSSAEQLGKKLAITETFACCGWDVTPGELKKLVDWQFVNGVNQICQHLMAYSIHGERKRDYPLTYSEHMAWFERYGLFNEYFSRLGYLISESRNEVNVLLLHPIKSAYLTYDRDDDFESIKTLELSFKELIDRFSREQIPHHYGDENLMARHGSVKNGKLIVGNYAYDFVVLPEAEGMDKTTLALLGEFVKQGGKLVLEGKKPSFLEGEPYAFDEIYATATEEDIVASVPYTITPHVQGVYSAYRKGKTGDFLYIVNVSGESVGLKVCCPSRYPVLLDLETLETSVPETEGGNVLLTLADGGSAILLQSDAPYTKGFAQSGGEIDLGGKWKVVSRTPNTLAIDKASLSYDGVSFEEKAYIPAIFYKLIGEKYRGRIWLKYTFRAESLPENIRMECENMGIFSCKVNGKEIDLKAGGTLDKSFLTADIAGVLEKGENEIVFGIDFYERDYVYFVLDDVRGEKESLKNCLSYDSEIEAIYLLGDFGVKDKELKFKDGCYLSDGNYELTAPVSEILAERPLTEQGYLFFAGHIVLGKKVVIDKEHDALVLSGRHAVADVSVDGKFVRSMLFGNTLDLSAFADGNEHELTIALYSGNRNLYGPFHCKTYEPLAVGPQNFDFIGTWKGYESPDYRESYSFVPFSLIRK